MRGIVTHRWLQAGAYPSSCVASDEHCDSLRTRVAAGEDYEEFETLMAESMCPAEDDLSTLNESVLEQLRAQNVDCEKVEQVMTDSNS